MKFIDSHSHIYLPEFAGDLPEVISRAKETGISQILLPNIDSTTIYEMLNVADEYPGYCYPMIGVHPTSIKENYKEELSIVEEQLKDSNRYIAIGEIGIDLYWDTTYSREQIDAFDRQLNLAVKYNLPVSIHTRNAFDQVFEVLSGYQKTSLKGIFHSFTGTSEEALKMMDFERMRVGINGVVTYKNSTLPGALEYIPAERIVIETDAPYLTPVPYRGKRNESAYLLYTLRKISEIYKIQVEEMANMTYHTTLDIFESLK